MKTIIFLLFSLTSTTSLFAEIVQLRFLDYNTEQIVSDVFIFSIKGETILFNKNEEGNIVIPSIEFGTEIVCKKSGYTDKHITINKKNMNVILGSPSPIVKKDFKNEITVEELKQIQDFVTSKVSLPEIAKKYNLSGEVTLLVTTNTDGSSTSFQLISGITSSFELNSKQIIEKYIQHLFNEGKPLSNKKFIITVPFQ